MEKLFNDFLSFTRSQSGFRTAENVRDMVAGRAGFKNYINPYILEERQLNVTTMDVFSRLMMDRIVFFGTDVNSDTANILVSQLLYLDNVSPETPIRIYVNSPGGEIYSGYSILDTMEYISSPVGTICTGLAASFGAMIMCCGEKGERMALPHARIMIHQPLGGAHGQCSDIQIQAKEIQKLKEELANILSAKCNQPKDKVMVDMDRDCWMTAEESVKYGIIDRVITKDLKK